MNAYNTYPYRKTLKRKSTVVRLLRAILEVICERLAAVELGAIAVVTSFSIALGIVGGMESGMLPVYIGLPVCLVLAAAGLLIRFED
ncbi:MAG: hypothetical protein IKU61_03225 [Clostridia bacterium]|nr:hypothetical protein [Clostridia bacterium]